MANKQYVINGELTEHAILSPDLLKKSTISVGPVIEIQSGDKGEGAVKTALQKKQYYQKFVQITYPDGIKSSGFTLPNVVIHHEFFELFDKTGVFFGIPKWIANDLAIKISQAGHPGKFEDRGAASDQDFWWVRTSHVPAPEGSEYIRVSDEEGDEPFGSFPELFKTYPSSVLANVTTAIKLVTDTDIGAPLKGTEAWRVSIRPSMVTAIDVTDIPAPKSTTATRSIAGKKDFAKPGLKKIRVNAV